MKKHRSKDRWLEQKEQRAKARFILDSRNFRVLWQKIVQLDGVVGVLKERYEHETLEQKIMLRIEYGA